MVVIAVAEFYELSLERAWENLAFAQSGTKLLRKWDVFEPTGTSLDRNKTPFLAMAIPKLLIKFEAGMVDAMTSLQHWKG